MLFTENRGHLYTARWASIHLSVFSTKLGLGRGNGFAPTAHSHHLSPPLLDYKARHRADFSNYHKGDWSQGFLLFKPISFYDLFGAQGEEGPSPNNMWSTLNQLFKIRVVVEYIYLFMYLSKMS